MNRSPAALVLLLLVACGASSSGSTADATSTPDVSATDGVVPIDAPDGPGPAVTGLATPEVVPGGVLVLTGRAFGTDPSKVTVRLSAGAGFAVAPVVELTDTRVTATIPALYDEPAPGEWCSWAKRLAASAWVVSGGASSNMADFTLLGIRACQPVIDSVEPAQPVAGDTISVRARGLSPDQAADLVELNGKALPVASVQTAEKADSTTPFDGTLRFVLPADAESGPLRIRRTDGIDGWSEPVTLAVTGSTGFPLTPGLEAGGAYLPILVYDVGLPSQRVKGDRTVWVLGTSDLPVLMTLADKTIPGVSVEVTTKNGSFQVQGINDADHVYVTIQAWGSSTAMELPAGGAEALTGIGPGDEIGLRVTGYDPTTARVITSVKTTITVKDRLIPGRRDCVVVVAIDDTLNLHCEGPYAKAPAQGELLTVLANPGVEGHVLEAPGLWDGGLTFSASGMMLREFEVPAPGTYTILDKTSGARLDLVVEGEGNAGQTVFPNYLAPFDTPENFSSGLAAEGVTLMCGGARLDIPPGALPEVAGGYNIECGRSASDFVPLASFITDGGFSTRIVFRPEPPRLLKPITLSLPFGEAGRTTVPEIGLADADQGVFFRYPTEVDETAKRVSVTFPAGEYPAATSAPAPGVLPANLPANLPAPDLPRAPAPKPPPFPECSIGQATKSVSPYSWSRDKGNLIDEERRIEVDYARDESGVNGVSNAYAEYVMSQLVRTYDFLKSKSWPVPDGWVSDWIVVTIAAYGPCSGTQGATTKGVFGQPWVYINSNCQTGNFLATTIAHEMGHVFQRQLTTNVMRQWMDEASAQWVACGTLGPLACDIEEQVKGGWNFAEKTLPNSVELNGSGFDDDQAYSAGALAIFLENEWSGCLLKYYQELSWNPSYWVYDQAYPLYEAATGAKVGDIVSRFAPAFWSQAFPPLSGMSPYGNLAEYESWDGVTIPGARPKYSSSGWIVRPDQLFNADLQGQQVVLRTKGLVKGQRVEVYGDQGTGTAGGGAGVVDWIITAYDDAPEQFVATFEPPLKRFRVVVINASESDATLTIRLVAPHIGNLSSSGAKNAAGNTLSISGVGFGERKGRVTMSGFDLSVTSWTDGSIQATTVLLPGSPDSADVRVETAEGALSSPASLAFGG